MLPLMRIRYGQYFHIKARMKMRCDSATTAVAGCRASRVLRVRATCRHVSRARNECRHVAAGAMFCLPCLADDLLIRSPAAGLNAIRIASCRRYRLLAILCCTNAFHVAERNAQRSRRVSQRLNNALSQRLQSPFTARRPSVGVEMRK